MLEFTVPLLISIFSIYLGLTSDDFNTDVRVKDMFFSPIPILENVNSYSILLEFSNMFVDKTMLIKEILESDRKVMIVALPRGFGKTVNMEMLKAFLQIEVDQWANELLPKNKTDNYRMFMEGIWVSESMAEIHNFNGPLLIAQHTELFYRYQGQRPIIHLQLSQAIDISYDDFYLEIRKSIMKTFLEHDYLMDHYKDIFFYKNGTEDEINAAKYKMGIFTDRISLVKDEFSVIESIYLLSKLLAEYFGRPVVILVDEYDHMLLQVFKWVLDSPEGYAYRNNQTERSVVAFFRKWFGRIFHRNEFCERAILNGRTLFCKDEVFAEVEDYVAIDAFTNPFQEYYGFTSSELERLFDLAEIPEDLRQDAKFWFHGYNLDLFSDLKVYNPFAIAGFLANRRISNYWENEYALLYGRDIRRLFQFAPLRQFYTRLMRGGTAALSLSDLTTSPLDRIHLAGLLAIKVPKFRVGDASSKVIIKELCVAGYLTNSGFSKEGKVRLRFPNMECISVCGRILNESIGNYSWFEDNFLFRFAPEYYDEIERIGRRVRTRKPNKIFLTPSRGPPRYHKPSTKQTYFMETLARTRRLKKVDYGKTDW